MLAGAEASRVDEVSERFARHHLSRHLRTDVRERFEWHRHRGDRVVIVSASPEVYVRVAGELLGADGVIATRLAVDGHGRLTGRYEGANCRGQEKLRRLRAWTEEVGARPDRLWAYGNSRGDRGCWRPPTWGSTSGGSAGWGDSGPIPDSRRAPAGEGAGGGGSRAGLAPTPRPPGP